MGRVRRICASSRTTADVTGQTLLRSAIWHVELESRIDTDDFSSYQLLKKAYDHRSVDREEAYVSNEGTHCRCYLGRVVYFQTVVARLSGHREALCLPLPQ